MNHTPVTENIELHIYQQRNNNTINHNRVIHSPQSNTQLRHHRSYFSFINSTDNNFDDKDVNLLRKMLQVQVSLPIYSSFHSLGLSSSLDSHTFVALFPLGFPISFMAAVGLFPLFSVVFSISVSWDHCSFWV